MVIRVLPRILYSTVQLPSISFLRKIQSFSNPPNLRSQFPSESPQNPQFAHQISLSGVLKRYGFPQSQLLQFIKANPFLSASSSSEIENCIRTLLSFGLTQKSLLSVLVNCPKSLQSGFVDEWVSALSDLGFPAVSSSLISTVLEQSGRFRIDPDDFRQNALRMKKNLGLSKDTVIRVFEGLPAAFMKEPVDVGRRVEVLISFGFEKEEIDRICFSFPLFLAFGVDGTLKPLFQEFKGLKLSGNEVKSMVLENPKIVFSLEVGEISRCIDLIRSLKCRVPIKDRIVANGRSKAGIDVKLRIDLLCKYGLIRRDAFKVVYLEPRSIVFF